MQVHAKDFDCNGVYEQYFLELHFELGYAVKALLKFYILHGVSIF